MAARALCAVVCLLALSGAARARTSISFVSRHPALHHHLSSSAPLEPAHTADAAPPPLCTGPQTFAIQDVEVSAQQEDLTGEQLHGILQMVDTTRSQHVRILIKGLPCAKHGCCEHEFLVRPRTTDVLVLRRAIGEYLDFLARLQPHVRFRSILDAGGNVGVATMVFAKLFPEAIIVALEPEPQNCLMLQANTLSLPNVRVHCKGLWSNVTRVAVVPHSKSEDWAWHIEEVQDDRPDAVSTTTIPQLLHEHGLEGFDFVKSDIEGAEFKVFGKDADFSWTPNLHVLALEIHDWLGVRQELVNEFITRGFHESRSGEYVVLATEPLHKLLV